MSCRATRFLLGLMICLPLFLRAGDDPLTAFSLWPLPQKAIPATGDSFRFSDLRFVEWINVDQKPVLDGLYGSLPEAAHAETGVISFAIGDDADLPEHEEGYVLEMADGNVKITARQEVGLFYGYQTLLQIAEEARDLDKKIPACRIIDYPDIPVRSVHLDLKHHLDAMHYYYGLVDRLANLKINSVIIEFEDKLAYRKVPEIGTSQSVSIDEFAALSRYAYDRHIRISPLVQGLGHASFILKHEKFKALRDNPASEWAFDPLNPETYELQFALYEDAMLATPFGQFLHVGGDEVGELGKSARAKASGMEPFELQMHWLQQVCNFAREKGRIPIFWDDMVFDLAGLYETTYNEKMPAAMVDSLWQLKAGDLDRHIGLFPESCLYMRWNYDTPYADGNLRAIDWYKRNGLPVMAATAAQTFWPMMPRKQSNFESIKQFCRIAGDEQLDGILCTAWDDSSPHFETFMRGIHTFAGMSWRHADESADAVHARYTARYYGSYDTPAVSFQDELERAMPFWETALLNSGSRNNAPRAIDLMALPDPDNPGKWSKQYEAKLAQASVELKRYARIDSAISELQLQARRNRYSLDFFNALNHIQVYPAMLLTALEAYDSTSVADKIALQQVVADFQERRNYFEEVVSKTRFLANPADYVVDDNVPNHLAAASPTSDWMYIYEIAFLEKMSDWLDKTKK